MKVYIKKNKLDRYKKDGWSVVDCGYQDIASGKSQQRRFKMLSDLVLVEKKEKQYARFNVFKKIISLFKKAF